MSTDPIIAWEQTNLNQRPHDLTLNQFNCGEPPPPNSHSLPPTPPSPPSPPSLSSLQETGLVEVKKEMSVELYDIDAIKSQLGDVLDDFIGDVRSAASPSFLSLLPLPVSIPPIPLSLLPLPPSSPPLPPSYPPLPP